MLLPNPTNLTADLPMTHPPVPRPALLVALALAAVGCGAVAPPKVADVVSGISFTLDPDNTRWEDDILVDDLLLLNDHADLTDVTAELTVGRSDDRAAGEWRKAVAWPVWKKGERKPVAVPAGGHLSYTLTGSAKKGGTTVLVDVSNPRLGSEPNLFDPSFEATLAPAADGNDLSIRLERGGDETLTGVDGVLLLDRNDGTRPERKKVYWTGWKKGETKTVRLPAFRYQRIEFVAVAERDAVSVVRRRAKGERVSGRAVVREVWQFEWEPKR